MSTSPTSARPWSVRYTVDSPTLFPLLRSRSWMSCALRKSSKLCSAVATALRCLVGRGPCGRPGSVLVIVPSVYGVPVAVVHVVDVVAVPHGRMSAVLPVLVPVLLGDGG